MKLLFMTIRCTSSGFVKFASWADVIIESICLYIVEQLSVNLGAKARREYVAVWWNRSRWNKVHMCGRC